MIFKKIKRREFSMNYSLKTVRNDVWDASAYAAHARDVSRPTRVVDFYIVVYQQACSAVAPSH